MLLIFHIEEGLPSRLDDSGHLMATFLLTPLNVPVPGYRVPLFL